MKFQLGSDLTFLLGFEGWTNGYLISSLSLESLMHYVLTMDMDRSFCGTVLVAVHLRIIRLSAFHFRLNSLFLFIEEKWTLLYCVRVPCSRRMDDFHLFRALEYYCTGFCVKLLNELTQAIMKYVGVSP